MSAHIFIGSTKDAHDPGLAVIAGLQLGQSSARRLDLEHRWGDKLMIDGRTYQKRLREPRRKAARRADIFALVSAQGIAESHRSGLICEIVCSPMVVHHPGVEGLSGFDVL